MASSTSPSIQHPALGQIQGTKAPFHEHVDQYLGLQYATLANRFARGTLVEKSSSPSTDATKIGPLPVASPGKCAQEQEDLIQHALPFDGFTFSDTECLTLNVSVPSGIDVDPKAPLPVIAFVHGGGFVTGSASWPQYDLAPLVERSVKIGNPVIAVGINYRLGPFGFLNSSAMREAGFLPNNGLHDQKLALRWIKKHISGFAGDPEKVTYLGSSIGAVSAFIHLQSEEPLFQSIVALGGSPLIQPLPLPVGDIAFSAVTSALGIADQPPAEQVQTLLSLPAEDLSAKLANVPLPLNAYHDNDIVKTIPSYAGLAQFGQSQSQSQSQTQSESQSQDNASSSSSSSSSVLYPGAKWCKTILMGDSQLDGMVMNATVLGHRPDNLPATLTKSLAAVFRADSDPLVTPVVKSYGIDATSASNPDPKGSNRLPVIHFINDIVFAQGAKSTADAWSRWASPGTNNNDNKAYLLHFNMPNPWPGQWQGEASHVLDIVSLLGNYNAFFSPGQRACAERLTDDFLRLAQGEAPFPSYAEGKSMVYYAPVDGDKDDSRVVDDADTNLTGRRNILGDVAKGKPEVMDQYLAGFGLFMQGGPK